MRCLGWLLTCVLAGACGAGSGPGSTPTTGVQEAAPEASPAPPAPTPVPAPARAASAPPLEVPRPEAEAAPPPPEAEDRRPVVDVVPIPAACFQMGNDDRRYSRDERPRHEVCLSAFAIDRVEVSNARYGACVEAGACAVPTPYPDRPALAEPDHPVVGVSWNDAVAYCAWVGMRLPTDAEWELAASGTDGRKYPWGDDRATCEHAVYAGCPPYSSVPVDSYPLGASPYGVLHMAGNAWEWVHDWHQHWYYARSPREDPQGPDRGGMRSIRGGCWKRDIHHIRIEDRDSGVPDLRNDHVGFRCACTGCE